MKKEKNKMHSLITVVLAGLLFFVLPSVSFAISGQYLNYRVITIDKTKVANTVTENYTNFPMLVDGVYPYLADRAHGGKVINPNGYDVAFYTSSNCGTGKMNWETERWDNTTGTVSYWVALPGSARLSTTTNTTFYMCYGNSSITTDQSSATATWDSNYLAVWHMKDSASNTTILDSTTNGRNGTSITQTATANTTGQIGKAQNFDGTINYIVSANYGLPTSFTIEAWGKTSQQGNVFSEQGAATRDSGWYDSQLEIDPGGVVKSCVWTGSLTCVNPVSSLTNNWHMFATKYDSASTKLSGFVDGAIANNASVSRQTPNSGNTYWDVGYNTSTNAGNANKFSGPIDEVRVSNIARSDDWLTTEYNNGSATSTFYTIGAEKQTFFTSGRIIVINKIKAVIKNIQAMMQ